MKRNVRRILSLALVLALVLSLTAPAFAEDAARRTRQNPGIKNIVTLGSSISYGCGANGTYDEPEDKFEPVALCFESYLAKTFGVEKERAVQGARNGWRSVEARTMLEPGFMGDSLTEYIYENFTRPQADWSEEYINAVKAADLITLEFGSDELLMRILAGLSQFFAENSEVEETEEGAAAAAMAEEVSPDDPNATCKLAQIMELLEQIGMYTKLLATLIDSAKTGVEEFGFNWNALVHRIRELNPTAIIVAVSMHNPMESFNKKLAEWGVEGLELLMGVFTVLSDAFINPINGHMAYGPYSCETHFCDISDIDMAETVDGLHPGPIGHQEIAERIETVVRSLFPCEHPKTEIRGKVEPTMLTLGYTGDTYCTDCGQTLSRGRAVSLRDVCQHDKGTYTVGDVKPTTKTTGLSGTVLCKNCGTVLENSVILPKLPCTHESTRLVGAVKATKLTAGYSGDEYCKDCGKLVHKGSIVPCTCDHSRTTVVGAVKATLLHPGFSGNTVCRDCGKIVATGETTYYKLFGKK